MSAQTQSYVLAGTPGTNQNLFHKIRFQAPDSAVFIERQNESPNPERILLVRDIEVDRARRETNFDVVGCAADFEPADGLSGDRDTAMAQAAAECLRRHGLRVVRTDRSLPYLFAHFIQQAGIQLVYDADLGVSERRGKTPGEIDALRRAQSVTQEAMVMACQLIACAPCAPNGILQHRDTPLTSERIRRAITRFLTNEGFSTPIDSIVATAPHVADCHHFGTGPLKTGVPIVIDIFPRDESSRYWGDCTRTVVHGKPTEAVIRMHRAVAEARQAGIDALRPGITGEQVHRAVTDVIEGHGYRCERGSAQNSDQPVMTHGTGHGIGLDVHEPILLDKGGDEVLAGEVFTVEPGLYSAEHGGVRIEDMVAVTENGCEVFGNLQQNLDWA